MNWREFYPALRFLLVFLAIYFLGNIFYGVFVESYGIRADPITRGVTHQTSFVLNQSGFRNSFEINQGGPTVFLKDEVNVVILNVYEGCNGINVIVVFIAFIFAFDGSRQNMFWFTPFGVIVIHLFNLLRIALLFIVSQDYPTYFYYIHKYVFTAVLYFVVFLLWMIWITKINRIKLIVFFASR